MSLAVLVNYHKLSALKFIILEFCRWYVKSVGRATFFFYALVSIPSFLFNWIIGRICFLEVVRQRTDYLLADCQMPCSLSRDQDSPCSLSQQTLEPTMTKWALLFSAPSVITYFLNTAFLSLLVSKAYVIRLVLPE